jgi:flagellar motor switch protein FliN
MSKSMNQNIEGNLVVASPADANPASGMDILDVELSITVSIGSTQLPLRDILKLTTGSVVELDRLITDPVDILVNKCIIARGEVVVIEGNYGVRILQVVSRSERLALRAGLRAAMNPQDLRASANNGRVMPAEELKQ